MLRTRRLLLIGMALAACAQVVAVQALAGAQPGSPEQYPEPAQSSPSETASPSPTSTPSESPTPSPSESPTPSPSGSETSSPSPSPSETPVEPGVLAVGSRASRTLVQVGNQVAFTVTVANRGEGALENVVVVDDVPAEITVAGVPIIDVEAIT